MFLPILIFMHRARPISKAVPCRIYRGRKPSILSMAPSKSLLGKRLLARDELVSELRPRLSKPSFFESLLPLGNTPGKRTRVFVFRGKKYVLKQTLGSIKDGFNPREIEGVFRSHQRAVQEGQIKAEKYMVKLPRWVKVIGNFLLMEFVEGRSIKEMQLAGFAERESFRDAYFEMARDFEKLADLGVIERDRLPQFHHLVVAENTSPGNPAGGKWVFFLPYDFA